MAEQQPLLTPTAVSSPAAVPMAAAATPPTAKSSGPNVVFALLLFVLVAAVALWANYEASKGFDIVVTNAAASTPAGRRFGLLFVENGRAARLVLAASDSVERVLYPDELFPRKPVARVTLYMSDAAAAADGLNRTVSVCAGRGAGEFVVRMSPAVMEAAEVRAAVAAAVRRGMARVWLRDGRGKAPGAVVDAMAEYLVEPYVAPAAIVDGAGVNASSASSSSSSCWEDREQAGGFVRYCEWKREGFVARLNRAMEEEWQERMVDDALLGSSSALLCSSYRSLLLLQRHDAVELTTTT